MSFDPVSYALSAAHTDRRMAEMEELDLLFDHSGQYSATGDLSVLSGPVIDYPVIEGDELVIDYSGVTYRLKTFTAGMSTGGLIAGNESIYLKLTRFSAFPGEVDTSGPPFAVGFTMLGSQRGCRVSYYVALGEKWLPYWPNVPSSNPRIHVICKRVHGRGLPVLIYVGNVLPFIQPSSDQNGAMVKIATSEAKALSKNLCDLTTRHDGNVRFAALLGHPNANPKFHIGPVQISRPVGGWARRESPAIWIEGEDEGCWVSAKLIFYSNGTTDGSALYVQGKIYADDDIPVITDDTATTAAETAAPAAEAEAAAIPVVTTTEESEVAE